MLELQTDIIDIGAISTRPNSKMPSIEEEIARFGAILPSIKSIVNNSTALLSIDSYNYGTIKYLIDQIPIAWINDQTGFIDHKIIELAKSYNLKLVIMHHLTIPTDPKKTIDEGIDVTLEVKNWLKSKANYLISQGIKPNQIIIDPGIGFGKTAAQSWQLIKDAKSFTKLGYEVIYGHSRKSFLNSVTNKPFAERDFETALLSNYLAKNNIDYLRVHNIELNKRAIKLSEFI
jgi:dihydropteroate synthase